VLLSPHVTEYPLNLIELLVVVVVVVAAMAVVVVVVVVVVVMAAMGVAAVMAAAGVVVLAVAVAVSVIMHTFIQGIRNYIPTTDHVYRLYSVATILQLQFMMHVTLLPLFNVL